MVEQDYYELLGVSRGADDAAIKAVSQWRYVPVKRNGRPVEQRARLRMRFAVEE